ncbi:cupin domain-containing protein [Halomonas getboli]|uniref:cupin domain-containing protein n=1 Tax=Halomonas getboli TaxID=2935862 RepID=UPI001FFFB526|nr:cupin domain-containing protein [Halomonas getboli]MCK2184127.1 cupin domain-containing protein [Halomonas getboli]
MNTHVIGTGVAKALGVTLLGMPLLAAGDATTLLTTELEGMEGMEVNVVNFEVGADWVTDRHIHPGHLFVYVTEGSLEVAVEGQEPRTVSAGEVFYEMPDQPMVGRTVSAEGAKFTVFQIGPAGEPIMVSQPE